MEMQWNKIIGHEKNIAQLQQLLQEERLPHALLFCGSGGIGKFLTARVLAAALLCLEKDGPCGRCPSCRALLAAAHPDFYVIEPEGKTNKQIKIEQIRQLQADIARAPYLAACRVVILNGADTMNEAAANSLLKTLEEPVGQVFFLLVAQRRDALLDTILSRTTILPFQPLQREQLDAALSARGIAGAEVLAGLAEGSLGRALELSENGGLERRDSVLSLLLRLPHFSLEDIWAQSQKLGELKREELQEWCSCLHMLLRDLLVLGGEGQPQRVCNGDRTGELAQALEDWPLSKVFFALDSVRQMQQRLLSNANARLLLEQFFIKIRDLK